jgi:ferredoxin-NADP reductase
MAMVRHARVTGTSDLLHLVVSVRAPSMLYYRDEMTGPDVTVVYTRDPPAGDARGAGRLRTDDLEPHLAAGATAYVCGAPGFCDSVTDLLVAVGVDVSHVRVERFGESG